ncbi:hypothetical protein FDP41_012226 [Naegleria fowleri]|uniref:Uncharacterized protein n=1 Tax=Naegleria fowleri TaxID=5763 RepID=A0A6A5C8G1_NAEFO|nr:uncharacterized protein FDP41_012226 [Naegleria fowleri]KAF0981569.1 hypothetical protein FDP41_012226 [Naegleria fowleri]CAG4716521.1 unnamed protein product [Naegleria fowleri]
MTSTTPVAPAYGSNVNTSRFKKASSLSRLKYIILGTVILFIVILLVIQLSLHVHTPSHDEPQVAQPEAKNVPLVSLNEKGETRDTVSEVTIWSTSFHISPIHCLKHFMKNIFEKKTGIKVNIIEKSLSGHCALTNTCAKDLKVLNPDNAKGENECVVPIAKQFYDAYVDDPEFKKADLVMCDHNVAMCEMYMAFDVPLVLYLTTRYELWRHQPERWKNLNDNLRRMFFRGPNSIIANNLYDAKYFNYFTGLEAGVVDSYCGYAADMATYSNPMRKEILIGPSRLSITPSEFFKPLEELSKRDKFDLKLAPIRTLYPKYEYSDLVNHPAIVIVPYQLSVMSFFEYYRMGIPLYFPSVDLLTRWHLKYRILSEKTWHMVLTKNPSRGSPLPRNPQSTVSSGMDPNNDVDAKSVRYWNYFADLYQWPHVIIYDSFEDLYHKLKKATPEYYKEVSAKMRKYSEQVQQNLIEDWKRIFEKAKKKKGRSRFSSFYEAIQNWGIFINEKSCDIA